MQSANSKIPLGKFAWLILLAVIAAPTAFFVLVTPKEPDEPPAPPVEKRPLSRLESVGLRDYLDWDGLPEIFAVWADKAHWENDRTRFAYWNPATRSYSYFFEARRTAKGYRFREIPEPHDPAFEWDPDATDDVPLRLHLPAKTEAIGQRWERFDVPIRPNSQPTRQVSVEIQKSSLSPVTNPELTTQNSNAPKKP